MNMTAFKVNNLMNEVVNEVNIGKLGTNRIEELRKQHDKEIRE